ncbi:hypothetical protein B0H17DRAFT_566365 [Mycena rosella]|uniref:Uncharacterized protein n=1 Tax=Mycena rosella TaxID=1033263 RepID=A0AAD7GEL8_MYCRO|nr:hypothetical protein B0H17DRAFT_566365 [Mycena rosella]
MSNLERLEIIGGFTGAYVEELRVQVPEDWEAPLFPHLRTLRLEDVGFGRASLALIQSFSREITGLELICTTGNHHLLPTAGEQWPVLHKLTVDTRDGVPEPAWLSPFIAARAAVGGNMRITDLTLIPLPAGHTLTVEPAPTMHWLCDGPAPALIDGVSRHGFYVDDVDGHVVDFAHVEYRYRGCSCGCEYQDSDCGDRDWYHGWRWDGDLERLCDDIAEEFKMTGELVRTKRMWREIRKRKRGGFKDAKVGRKLRVGERTSRNHARVYDFGQDFWMG